MKFLSLIFGLVILSSKFSFAETCSRVATINYQEVLVDAGSGKMGEGLRFYLEKDPESKKLLDEYQKRNKPTLWSASASTVGSFLILSSLLQTNESSGIQNKNTLLYSGVMLVGISYLMSKTMKYSNEKYLKQAVDQYNKRNSPRIYFSPFRDNNGGSGATFGVGKRF